MNADLFSVGQPVSMSSREIADLCEKNHADVLRDIRVMLDQLGEVASRFAGNYLAANGKQNPCFHLPKDLTLTLVSGYNVRLRKRIIDRWMELEASAPALSGPQLMAAALVEADATLKRQAQQIATMKADVQAHARLTKADGSLNITEAAKTLGMRPKTLFDWLSQNGWIYKRPYGRAWLGYQAKCNQGLLEHKTTTISTQSGVDKISEQVRITPKGLSRLASQAAV